MKVIKNTLIALSIGTTLTFAGSINKGPEYLKGKHYKLGKDDRYSSKNYDKDFEVRFWEISNFGKGFNIDKVSEKMAKKITKAKKTHYTNKWYWKSIKNDEYLMIGYSNKTTGEFAESLVKRVDKNWFYTCNGESWYELEEGKASSCSVRIGYDTVKLQFSNPIDGKSWSSNDILYRFAIKDR